MDARQELGTLNAQKSNVILMATAISGNRESPRGQRSDLHGHDRGGAHRDLVTRGGVASRAPDPRAGDRRPTLSLKALHRARPREWPRVGGSALADYLGLGAADLGDLHNDPFVAKLERLDATSPVLGRRAQAH